MHPVTGLEFKRSEMLGEDSRTIDNVGLDGIPPNGPKQVIITLIGAAADVMSLLLSLMPSLLPSLLPSLMMN